MTANLTMKKRHTPEEIAAKLRQADDLAAQGTPHRDIARILGISVMTYHRWRQARTEHEDAAAAPKRPLAGSDEIRRIDDLQLENSRLRRLVTDLLLEKVALEEAIQKRPGRR